MYTLIFKSPLQKSKNVIDPKQHNKIPRLNDDDTKLLDKTNFKMRGGRARGVEATSDGGVGFLHSNKQHLGAESWRQSLCHFQHTVLSKWRLANFSHSAVW